MKKQLASIFMCFISVFLNAQDCPPVSVDLSTQQEVDDFPILYPDCTHILGNVSISSGITNLNGLNNITVIDGDLFMEAANTLDDLSGLSNLTTIGGKLSLPPSNITGMNSLTSVDEWVVLMENVQNTNDIQLLSDQIVEIRRFELSDPFSTYSGSLTLFANLTSIDEIGFYSTAFTIQGFNQLSTIEFMTIQNFPAAEIILPTFDSLIYIGGLELFGIDVGDQPFPMGTGADCLINWLWMNDCHFSGFDYFTGVTNLGVVELVGCEIESFNGWQNVQSIESLTILSVEGFTSFDGLQGATEIGNLTVEYSFSLTSLSGIENVTHFENLTLSHLSILTDISALNPLAIIDNIRIVNNESLSNCAVTAICSNLDAVYTVIADNNNDCEDIEQVQLICNGNYVTGTVFYDLNCNGTQDENEVNGSNYLIVDENELPIAWISSQTGNYYLQLPYNSNIVYHAQTLPGFFADEVAFTTSSEPQAYEYNISVCPQGEVHNLSVIVTPNQSPRPGFTHGYQVTVNNYGTEPASGILTFSTNEMGNVTVIDAGGADVNGSLLSWNFPSVNPFSSWSYYIELYTPAETPIGTIYNLFATVNFADELVLDLDLENNIYEGLQEVIGSFDPNDIVVDQTIINYENIISNSNAELEYIIHFQNTGTASAITVRVENVIESDLNFTTLQFLQTSHDAEITFEGNKIIWTFENIDLPASIDDEAGSMGFIHYRIKTNSNIPLETIIENNCNIFFDFNEPILTNTATTTFYQCPESVNIVGPNEICVFNAGVFEADDLSLAHYEWLLDGNLITEETTMEFTFTQPGSHELLLMAENQFCNSVQTIELQVVENPAIGISIESLETCNEVTLLATSNAPVTWSLNNNVVGYGSPNTVFESGDYIGIAENVCGIANASIAVNIPEGPTDLHILEDIGVLSSNLTGVSYNWYFEGEQIPDANESTYTPTELGNYSLHVEFESGCSLDADYTFFTISISNDFEENTFLSPNPAKEFSTLNLKDGSEYVHLEIYTITGQLIKSENITGKNHRIDTSHLEVGMYFIQMSNADRKVCSLPLMVE